MHKFLLHNKSFIMPSSILNPSNTSWLECSCCHHLLFEKHNQSNIIHIRRHIIHTCPHCDTSFRYIISDEKLFRTLQSCGDIVDMTDTTTNILSDLALSIDPECLTDMSNTYAFWKYDVPPYLLGDKVIRFTQDGFIVPEHYTGSVFKPIYITTLEKGLQMQKNLDAEFEKYKQLTNEANELIKTASNIENLILSVS